MYVAVDFETTAILPRPEYPPTPVGVAILMEGRDPEYLAWGHPTNNNTQRDYALGRLSALWFKPEYELIFHNAAFDLDVAREHFHLTLPPWERIHDTQMMAFLVEPENPSTALKELAKIHLGMAPEEQDDLFAWIRHNVPEARRKKNVGGFISQAPGDLVGRYAVGDVVRTLALFHHFYGWIEKWRVGPAYDRERRLLPALLDMARRGVRVDEEGIASALQEAEHSLEIAGGWLQQALQGSINLNSGEALADRIQELGWVREHEWHRTWKGHRQTSIPSLRAVLPPSCHDFLDVYRYYSMLSTVTRFQLRPWSQTEAGRIYCQWNSTRQSRADGRSKGARTGRLSSTPNFQNIPRRIPRLVTTTAERRSLEGRGIEAVCLEARALRECTPIPHPREFILPEVGHLFAVRDFSQQELRILAHYAGGPLSEAYNSDPHLDMHSFARSKILNEFGLDIPRGGIKGVGFGVIYGQSIGGTAALLGLPFDKAKEYREAYFRALGTVDKLIYKLKCRAANDEPFRTWGGRLYWCEEQKIIDGEIRTFEYKMLNTLIQGSAGDHIKEVMVQAHEQEWPGRVVLTVHDEVVAEAPREAINAADRRLDEIMVGPQFAVPMVTDGKIGENWEVCK